MPGIANKDEFVAELESVLASAEAGEPVDAEKLRNLTECAREYVPDFEASGDEEGMPEDMDSDDLDVGLPAPTPPATGNPLEGLFKEKVKRPSMVPMYGKGR